MDRKRLTALLLSLVLSLGLAGGANAAAKTAADFPDYDSQAWYAEAMAAAVVEGAKEKGAEVSLLTASEFSPEQVSEYDAIAFGCPSMGSEQLEESEFEPMFTACEGRLSGKSIALFGSYGWGDGEWMRSWEARCNDDGANLVCDSVICNEAPDEEALSACRALGAALA